MKSKLALLCVTVLANATWWVGCGGSSDGAETADSGTGAETGGNPEGGGNDAGGTDAAADAKLDTTVSGPFIDLTYGSCTALAKCDSSVVGTWKVSGGCVSETAFDTLKTQAMCPTLTTSDVKFQARGVVSANALSIANALETKFEAKAFIPMSCTGGFACNQIGPALTAAGMGIKTAACVDSAGAAAGCDCAVTGETKTTQAADTYKTSAGVLTTGSGRTYDYCATATELKYTETNNNAQLPATLTLTKQ